jgi:hypothetical protein
MRRQYAASGGRTATSVATGRRSNQLGTWGFARWARDVSPRQVMSSLSMGSAPSHSLFRSRLYCEIPR